MREMGSPYIGHLWVHECVQCGWRQIWKDRQLAKGLAQEKKEHDIFSSCFTARSQVCPVLRKIGTLRSGGQERTHFSSLCSIPRTVSAH